MQATTDRGAGPHCERRKRPNREEETAERDLRIDGASGLLEGLQRSQGLGNVQGGEEKPGEAPGHGVAGKPKVAAVARSELSLKPLLRAQLPVVLHASRCLSQAGSLHHRKAAAVAQFATVNKR